MDAKQVKKLITVGFWPNNGQWRILIAGVAVGYWPTKEEAELRARHARDGIADIEKITRKVK